MTNLVDIFTMVDDTNPEQHYFDTSFIFEDSNGKKFMYSIQHHMGMHLQDFKDFFSMCAQRMKTEDPYECEFENDKDKN